MQLQMPLCDPSRGHLAGKPRAGVSYIHPIRDEGSVATRGNNVGHQHTDEQDRCRTIGQPRQTLASRIADSPNLRCRYQPGCGPAVVDEAKSTSQRLGPATPPKSWLVAFYGTAACTVRTRYLITPAAPPLQQLPPGGARVPPNRGLQLGGADERLVVVQPTGDGQ